MNAHLRAGIAIYNAGRYHAAHDAWEECWLDSTGDDERLLHGLIQFTAAVHHASTDNRAGATGLAESAREYLCGLPADYRGVNVGDAREFLAGLHEDFTRIEREPPLPLTHEGRALSVSALGFEASAVAARVFADADGFDTEPLERAIEYARADLDASDETSAFVALVMDFARGENRATAYQRLAEHTERRRAREGDADGLFEKR